MSLVGLLVDWTWLRKESLNLRISIKASKTKKQTKKTRKKLKQQNRIWKNCGDNYKRYKYA